jgi:D-arabinonate dehydratase
LLICSAWDDALLRTARVAAGTAIPIASGENEYTRHGFRDLIEHRAAAILNADAIILGGITDFMKVAAFAQAYDLPIAPHGRQEVHAHLVAAIPNGLIVEYYYGTDPASKIGFREPLELIQGQLILPERPGLGVDLDEAALAPHRIF